MPDGPRAIVWMDAAQAALVREVARIAGFSIVAAGSPAKGQTGAVASAMECEPASDLRSALTEADVELVFLADAGEFGGPGSGDDAGAVSAAHARGVKVATIEPVPAAAIDLSGAWGEGAAPARPADAVRHVAMPRLSRAMRESHEALSAFGPARVVQVEAWSNPMEGSLGARLFGAMDAVHGLLGEPETIDAAYVGKSYVTGVHTLPGESLRDLHGDIAATMRFADGRAAVVTASNAAGRWNSCTTLLSEKGRMRIYDDGYEWVGVTGQKQDELRLRRTRGAADQSLLGAAAIAESIGELLDTGKPPPPVNSPVVLAMCQAALLSARTGQPESPATLRGLMGLRM